ncbi:MAG: GNAT family N-acetyltransferase [Pseudomonadota bacterium]
MTEDLEIELVGKGANFVPVHKLLVAAFAFMEGRIDPPSSLARLRPIDLKKMADDGGCLLARKGGKLVGCLFLSDQPDCLMIAKLAVAPKRQGQGIGRALVEGALRVALSLSKPVVRLQTRVELVENHQAFARLGFVETGRTSHDGYDHPTSITMEHPL